MSAIIDFFSGIADTFSAIIDFIVGFFQDLVYVIGLLGQFLAQIGDYFFFLPEEALIIIGVIFGIAVIYMILGRTG